MKRRNRLFLSVLSGVLLSGAWLGFPGWTLFFAFIPLLYLDKFFTENKTEFRSVSFWSHALLAFFIWNSITTWWIFYATPIGMALAIITNSFLMAGTFWLAHIAQRNFRSNLGYIAFVVFWLSFEYFHFHWDIEWPWLTLGNGFANNVKMVQWYEFTGFLGGSLWVLIMNILLYKLITNVQHKQEIRKLYLLISSFVLLLFAPVIVSFVMYYSYSETNNPKHITIIQPNIDPYSEKYDIDAEQEKLQKFLALAAENTGSETDFIIGPETLFENPGKWNENEFASNTFLHQLTQFLQSQTKAEMVFGVTSFKTYPNKETAPATARTRGDMTYDMFNTALFLNRKGETQIYHKSELVVGVEKMPFSGNLGFLGDIIINIGGTSGSLGRQTEPSVFIASDGTKIAPVICYESVFGEFVTKYVRKGAQMIFIITNDGWWRNTPGYKQHLSFARLRAIETRRSIARSANTGISCFINQRGDVLQASDWWIETAIKGTINANDKITFYVRFGDYIARISLLMSILLILQLLSDWVMKKKEQLK